MVILRQDPYHGGGQAEGWRFCRAPGAPAALAAEHLQGDATRPAAFPVPEPGRQSGQVGQNGVLLLNTCLTVEEGQAASHAGKELGGADRYRHPPRG